MSLLSVTIKKIKKYFSKEEKEIRRLLRIPRYTTCSTSLLDGVILSDSISFVAGYQEIFKRENYKIEFSRKDPFIIDCGSNIGLSLIYFKKKYPKANIIGFEPDPVLFEILKKNTTKFSDILLYNKALGSEKGKFNFISEGGFSGRIIELATGKKTIEVEVDTLSTFITQKVDFLKIDIEGLEYQVLINIKSKLGMVDKIFLEYHSLTKKSQDLDLILALLKNEGFRVHIKEAASALHPFIEVPSVYGMDNQIEIYAWRNK